MRGIRITSESSVARIEAERGRPSRIDISPKQSRGESSLIFFPPASSFLITSTGTSTTASNATGSVITKLATAPTWIGLLIVVVFASAILAYFYFRG